MALTVSFLFATSAFAHPPINVYVDSQAVSFDQAPIIINDRTLVPMRAIFQALGSEVSWYEPTKTVTSTKDGDSFVLVIGQTGLYKNGQLVYSMDVPAQIVNDRTMVPVRAIAEAFDAEVNWDPVGYVITIFSAEDATQNSYSTTVEAEDGTVVLSYKMSLAQSSNQYAAQMEKVLLAEAEELAKDFVNTYGAKAKKDYEGAKAAGNSFAPYYSVGSYEITREDSALVSFYGTSTGYTGGSETVRSCSSHTFSAKNGKEQKLSDLIDDSQKEIEAFWSTSFGTLIDEKPTGFYSDAKKRLEKCMDKVGFYLTADGIAFYLPPETIAPKEAGIISFTMKYEF